MRKVWYLYRNGINYGMRDNILDAIVEVYSKTSNLPNKTNIQKANTAGYYQDGEYKAVKEYIK